MDVGCGFLTYRWDGAGVGLLVGLVVGADVGVVGATLGAGVGTLVALYVNTRLSAALPPYGLLKPIVNDLPVRWLGGGRLSRPSGRSRCNISGRHGW